MTEIQEFYTNSTIFLTGATGFVGKLVLEKLLRSCFTLNKIFILIREKRNKSSDERFEEIFEAPVWDKLRILHPNFQAKLVPIEGNCMEVNLGLSAENLRRIIDEVDVVMHCAATVRFNEEITKATQINIRAVTDLIRIAKRMSKLRAMVHVSTAYSNCTRDVIEERFYDPPISPENLMKIIDSFDQEILQKSIHKVLGEFPNTYTFTKNLGESVVAKEGRGLPIAIIRPSIIAGTYQEPIEGYIDKPFGFTGSVQGIVYGVLRCIRGNPAVKTDVIPGDYVANNIIAAGWYIGSYNNNINNVQIYHSTSSGNKLFNVRDYVERIVEMSRTKYASSKALWYPFAFVISSKLCFALLWFLLHTLPAYAIFLFSVSERNNKKLRLVRLYRKTRKLTSILGYFMSKQWEFKNENCKLLYKQMSAEDRALFKFSMEDVDWEVLLERQIKGIQLYLAGENRNNERAVSAGRKYIQRLYFYHYFCAFLIAGCVAAALFYAVYCSLF